MWPAHRAHARWDRRRSRPADSDRAPCGWMITADAVHPSAQRKPGQARRCGRAWRLPWPPRESAQDVTGHTACHSGPSTRDIGDSSRTIHFLRRGHGKECPPLLFQAVQRSRVEGPRILGQVFSRPKLQGVDENRRCHHIALWPMAARTSDRWPWCNAPIVGTKPKRLPSRRASRDAARMSSIVLQTFMAVRFSWTEPTW